MLLQGLILNMFRLLLVLILDVFRLLHGLILDVFRLLLVLILDTQRLVCSPQVWIYTVHRSAFTFFYILIYPYRVHLIERPSTYLSMIHAQSEQHSFNINAFSNLKLCYQTLKDQLFYKTTGCFSHIWFLFNLSTCWKIIDINQKIWSF